MCVSTQLRYPEGDMAAAVGIVAAGIIAAAAVLIDIREWSENAGVRMWEG